MGDMVIPSDLRGVSPNFAKDFDDDFDVMVEKLGGKGTAEGLLNALEYFKANKGKDPEDERETPITVKDGKDKLNDDGFNDDEEDEEEDADEDEDADGEDEEEEEEAADGEEAAEPPQKKKKEWGGRGAASR